MKKITASIYDFPVYYDLVFGSDTASELKFFDACCERFVSRKVKRVFEPACGTGRLIYRMAQNGYSVGGVDLNEKAVQYCNRRLEKHGLGGRAFVGDMTDFSVAKPFDAAINTINSFRHLSTEKQASAHLDCMAEAVRPGGIYLLGLHLTPTRGEPTDEESWSARRGQLVINTHMWPVEKDKRRRLERFGIRFDVYKPTESFRIEDVLTLRSYTARQFQSLLSNSPKWEVLEYFDFGYDIREPIEVVGDTEDIVVVLQRRK